MASLAPPESAPPRSQRQRGQWVLLGLALTFVGLFLLIEILPVGAGALSHLLPVAGAGMLLLWVGGIFLGRSRAA